jgi:DNA anti-recombination protein RmuC
MHHPDDPFSPGDRARRRGLFSSGRPSPDVSPDPTEYVEEMMGVYQATIQRQLEEGLSAIRHTANTLMHEIASEVWRTAGGDKDEVRSRILHELSRDQAIRSLIAHSDERFQALAVRSARLEDTLNLVADSVRGAKAQLAESVDRLGEPTAFADAAALRTQLAEITRQVAGALKTLAERDQEVVEAVRARILEHGELITQETTRISGAMESYVRHGVEAIGQLAGSMEAQVHALAARDDDVAERIQHAVDQQTAILGEQLQLMYERIALDTTAITETANRHTDRDVERVRALAEQVQLMYERMAIDTTSITEAVNHQGERDAERDRALGEYLHVLSDRVDVARRDTVNELNSALSTRVLGLARLVRSDAEALRRELVRTAEPHDERIAAMLDERLARVSQAVEAGTTRMAEELVRRIGDETADAVRARVDEAVAGLATRTDEQSRLLDGRMGEALSSLDGRMGEALSSLDGRVGEALSSLDGRVNEAASTIDRNLNEMTGAIEAQFERLGNAVGDRAASGADQGIAALARLVRSDNELLAKQIAADQEASKQALRAMKELQANLPDQVIEMVEQRFSSLAESIERSNETLAKRIDKMTEKIGERYDSDIQVVIDRMGDAMHALASLGKGEGEAPAQQPRIELE